MSSKKLKSNLLIVFFFLIQILAQAQLSPKDAISQMKKGINLGNTLEPPYEGDWGNPPTEEYFFDMYKAEGFDFIRIPVQWDKHMATTSPFKINETWLKRVEQILDWGLERGLYMVVNSHHDGWIKENYANPVNQARFDSLWSQVAVRFKNKSEKLLFEIANEPVDPMTKAQNDEMHQKAIKVIRKTNPTRLIIFQGISWGSADALIDAAIPDDNFIIGSFHSYDPYLFGLEGKGTWGTTADLSELRAKFQKVKDWSVKNNIPVFLGEFGSIKSADYNSRMKHYKTYVEFAHSFGFASAAWDDGGNFKIMNRQAKTWDDDIKDILTHSSELSPQMPHLQIAQDTVVKLFWTNPVSDYDSIFIEQRLAFTTWERIAILPGNAVSYSDIDLPQSVSYFYRVIAHYTNGSDLYSYPQKIFLPTYVPKEPLVRGFFTGQALPIPGIIEAENFDLGGEGLTYHDSDSRNITGEYRPDDGIDIYKTGVGTYLVADNLPGEWLEYTVNVAQTDQYDFNAYTASFAGGGTFKIKVGQVESDLIKVPATSSAVTTKKVSFTLNLEAGIQIMRFTFINTPSFNFDYLDVKKTVPTSITDQLSDDQITIYQAGQELIVHTILKNPVDQFKLYSFSGSEIKTKHSPGKNFSIPVHGINPGIYVVQLISGSQKFSRKIIIQ